MAIMRAFVVAMMVSIVGCVPGAWGYEDVALSPKSEQDRWFSSVERAAGAWNSALRDRCHREMFAVTPVGGHEVRLVPAAAWDRPQFSGYLDHDGGFIAIRDGRKDSEEQRILIHELGHALGLAHVTDHPSIMEPDVGDALTAADVEAVIALAGC